MNQHFQERIYKLPSQLEQLLSCKQTNRGNLKDMPQRGVYLFIELDKPIYVGRTDRLKDRLFEHGRVSSSHNTASFAFKLAREQANGLGVTGTREALVANEQFCRLFIKARQRVAEMDIKYIGIENSVDQYLLEVYASEVLETPYNDFDNH